MDELFTIPWIVYVTEKIRVLTTMQAISHRPGMYIGGTDSRAMLFLLLQIVKEQVEIAAAGKCQEIQIYLRTKNTIMIHSDGPGCLMLGQENWDATDLKYLVAAMLVPGPTSAVVYANALSTEFKVEIRRGGKATEQSYQQGIAAEPPRSRGLKTGESTGVTIIFTPDLSIFDANASLSYPDLYVCLREFAFLVPGLCIRLFDERGQRPVVTEFHYENSLADFVRYLNRDCVLVCDVIHQTFEVEFKQQGAQGVSHMFNVDFAIQFTDCAKPFQLSFVNCKETKDGGIHIDQLRRGIRDAILVLAQNHSLSVTHCSKELLRGMTAVVHIRHPHPTYTERIPNKLIEPDCSVIYALVYKAIEYSWLFPLKDFLERTAVRSIPNKERRYGEQARQVRYSIALY